MIYFYVPPIVCRGSVLVFVLICITLCPFQFCNRLDEKERAGYFAFIVFWISCYSKCPVALPYGAVGWSAVCDCGVSWSYSLTFCHYPFVPNYSQIVIIMVSDKKFLDKENNLEVRKGHTFFQNWDSGF